MDRIALQYVYSYDATVTKPGDSAQGRGAHMFPEGTIKAQLQEQT